MINSLSSDDLICGVNESIKDELLVDPRMYDFWAGNFLYDIPTECPEFKFQLLKAFGVSLDNVITVVGGGWPLIYSQHGALHTTAFDINIKQINHFIASSKGNEDFIKDLSCGKISIHFGDLTQLNSDMLKIYSNASLIDITNVLDYMNPGKAAEYLVHVASSLRSGSAIVLSSVYPERIIFFKEQLGLVGFESDVFIGENKKDDYADNFLICKRI